MEEDEDAIVTPESYVHADGSCVVTRGSVKIPNPTTSSGTIAITVFNFDVQLDEPLYVSHFLICVSALLFFATSQY